jgi:hypothetical protein
MLVLVAESDVVCKSYTILLSSSCFFLVRKFLFLFLTWCYEMMVHVILSCHGLMNQPYYLSYVMCSAIVCLVYLCTILSCAVCTLKPVYYYLFFFQSPSHKLFFSTSEGERVTFRFRSTSHAWSHEGSAVLRRTPMRLASVILKAVGSCRSYLVRGVSVYVHFVQKQMLQQRLKKRRGNW